MLKDIAESLKVKVAGVSDCDKPWGKKTTVFMTQPNEFSKKCFLN